MTAVRDMPAVAGQEITVGGASVFFLDVAFQLQKTTSKL
jgi:hypothetical protein